MKKIYLLLFLFFIVAQIQAQTILNQNETVSRTVQDPKTVILSPGFNAKGTNPFVARLGNNISAPQPPFVSSSGSQNPSGETSVPGDNISFHDSKGELNVDGSGQLNYSLPIALPPGILSVAPQMNLVYSSGSGNGTAGYGWNVTGITSIARIGKNIEKNGNIEGVKMDYTDFYQFNGSRLLLKSGVYGKDGAEYVTEKFSNLKIKSAGAIAGQNYQGPEHWEITFEDGSQAWYGVGNSKNPTTYNMSKWIDVNGNSIIYTYLLEKNVNSIKKIEWGGNETLGKPHFNEINFEYTPRDFKEVAYNAGIAFVQQNILTNVVVNTNGAQFKKYAITYKKVGGNNYQYIDKITEYNSKDEAAEPVVFENEDTSYRGRYGSFEDIGGNDNDRKFVDNLFNGVYGSVGDFNGDGDLDVIYGSDVNLSAFTNTPNKVYGGTGYISSAIGINFINKDGFLSNKQKVFNIEKRTFDVYTEAYNPIDHNWFFPDYNYPGDLYISIHSLDFNKSYPPIEEFSTLIPGNKFLLPKKEYVQIGDYEDEIYEYLENDTTLSNFKEVDIDGDGISEVLLEFKDERNRKRYQYIGGQDVLIEEDSSTEYRLFVLKMNCKDGKMETELHFLQTSFSPLGKGNYLSQFFIGDFNGNGKTDFLSYNGYTALKEWNGTNIAEVPSNFTLSASGNSTFVGDFNGDSKTDLMIPVKQGESDWVLHLSTGTSFVKENKPGFLLYKPFEQWTQDHGTWYSSDYIRKTRFMHYSVLDLDKDGKSEFVVSRCYNEERMEYAEGDFTTIDLSVYKNVGANNTATVNFSQDYHYENYYDDKIFDLGLVSGDYRLNSYISNVFIIGKERYDRAPRFAKSLFYYDSSKLARIKAITQGGIKTEIEYKDLNTSINPDLYAPVKQEKYPYMEVSNMAKSLVVSQLRQLDRKQDFKYRGFTVHLQGQGAMGYRQTARSSWYADGFEKTKVWAVNETDPLKSGTLIKEWTTKNESNLFPPNVNENTLGLLSFTSTTYLNNPLVSGEKALVVLNTLSKNFLTNTITKNSNTYNTYFLPIKQETDINNGQFTKKVDITYEDNPAGVGKDFYIGRIVGKKETANAYGDTKIVKSDFTFLNNKLSTVKNYDNKGISYVQETYIHDGFGNVIEKTISNSKDSQTQKVKTEYDPKGRFVIKKTDNIGLETKLTYNDWGQVESQIDPLGNSSYNTYDNWGKVKTSSHNLVGITKYTYQRKNFTATITKYLPDGDIETSYINPKGETYLVKNKSLNENSYTQKEIIYDVLGRKIAESQPYFTGETPKWNTIQYNDTSYPPTVTATSFNGKQMETKAIGFTTISKELNGYQRTTKKTVDALNNTIETEDKGGLIKFTYNAAGQNLTATYDTNVVTTTYDDWGRKESFHDPANGLYGYTYDGFGQLKKETSPLGYKEFEYNNLGQLTKQTEKSNDGKSTNKSISFIYDNKGRITNKNGTSNGKSFGSYITYDTNGRIIASGEDGNGRYFFRKNLVYDNNSRLLSYEKGMYSGGTYTKVNIENIYSAWNGDLIAIKDKDNQKTLWQITSAKANGQILTAMLGNVGIHNAYDSNNFLKSISHETINRQNGQLLTVLSIGYNFDAIKNELNQRTRTGFGITTENFVYDNNNRLLNWTNPKTGQLSNNVYDDKGRIVENDQLGKVNFTDQAKVYQATSIEPNTNLAQHWPDAQSVLQKVTYNENNDPVYLDGKDGDYAFEYGLTESRQAMHYGGNFTPELAAQQAKYSKYYSEDSSYEIIRDNATGQEKHLMYIGGSPYESEIVLVKNFAQTTPEFVFLHKDYLGTILAITNEAGAILEQRHFDAWGVITHNANAAGQPIADNAWLIDRGYTSHEHLQDVGIIHMNGRLYDPLMRRFLNADENIQDPNNTQNYNKYGYVMNNPLMFNDPSGEFIWFLGAAWCAANILAATLITGAVIGAAVGLAGYLVTMAATRQLGHATLGGVMKAVAIGAISGAITAGIGEMFNPTVIDAAGNIAHKVSTFAEALGNAKILVQAGCHAVAQGALSLVQGGNFLTGAASGFMGHLGGELWGSVAGNWASSTTGIVTFGAISGGIGAELTDGNFWQGAITGGIVAGLNKAMHQMMQENPNKQLAKQIAKKYGYDDWKEISTFLDENAFTLTHEGVSFIGYEAVSSKYGESNISGLIDSGTKKGATMVLGQALKKIIGKGAGQLLSSTEINMPDHPEARFRRIEECKQRLTDYIFKKPLEYQVPSMNNNMQSWKPHSSIYDTIMHRYY